MRRTGDIGLFKVTGEGGVTAGVPVLDASLGGPPRETRSGLTP